MIDPAIKALAQGPNYAALAVPLPSGQIMNHVMWVDATDDEIWINTEPQRPKYAAMKAAVSVTVTVIDMASPYHYGEVRGTVVGEITGEEALAHIHALSQRYMGQAYPYETEGRVILRIAPVRQRVQ